MDNDQQIPQTSHEGLDVGGIVLIGIALILLAGGIIFVIKGNTKSATDTPQPTIQALDQPQNNSQLQNVVPSATVSPTKSPMDNVTQLQKIDEKVGAGAEATNGAKVTVNYLGTLTDGKKFDSSYDRNQPFSFTLGAGQVIQGWDQGVLGMKVGGKRKLIIPSSLGYGSQGTGPIPGNATLIFEVELLNVE